MFRETGDVGLLVEVAPPEDAPIFNPSARIITLSKISSCTLSELFPRYFPSIASLFCKTTKLDFLEFYYETNVDYF